MGTLPILLLIEVEYPNNSSNLLNYGYFIEGLGPSSQEEASGQRVQSLEAKRRVTDTSEPIQ